jgi:hypothetical protein
VRRRVGRSGAGRRRMGSCGGSTGRRTSTEAPIRGRNQRICSHDSLLAGRSERSLTYVRSLLQVLLPLRVQRRGLRRDSPGSAVAGGPRGVRHRLLRRPHVRRWRRRCVSAGSTAAASCRHRLKRLRNGRFLWPISERGISSAVARRRAELAPSRRGSRSDVAGTVVIVFLLLLLLLVGS